MSDPRMFDSRAYGAEIANILALDCDGERLMPLVQVKVHVKGHVEVRVDRISDRARELVKAAKIAPALRAGLYLYFDCWEEAHEVAQDIATPEGSYWHAIVHRQEPDAANAAYWFRQVGVHPIWAALEGRAAEIGVATGAEWDPIGFIDYCARAQPGSPDERKARELQRAEWQLLFDWCAR